MYDFGCGGVQANDGFETQIGQLLFAELLEPLLLALLLWLFELIKVGGDHNGDGSLQLCALASETTNDAGPASHNEQQQ